MARGMGGGTVDVPAWLDGPLAGAQGGNPCLVANFAAISASCCASSFGEMGGVGSTVDLSELSELVALLEGGPGGSEGGSESDWAPVSLEPVPSAG